MVICTLSISEPLFNRNTYFRQVSSCVRRLKRLGRDQSPGGSREDEKLWQEDETNCSSCIWIASETYVDGNSTVIPCFGKVLSACCIRLHSTSILLRVLSMCFFTFAYVLCSSLYFSFCHYFSSCCPHCCYFLAFSHPFSRHPRSKQKHSRSHWYDWFYC